MDDFEDECDEGDDDADKDDAEKDKEEGAEEVKDHSPTTVTREQRPRRSRRRGRRGSRKRKYTSPPPPSRLSPRQYIRREYMPRTSPRPTAVADFRPSEPLPARSRRSKAPPARSRRRRLEHPQSIISLLCENRRPTMLDGEPFPNVVEVTKDDPGCSKCGATCHVRTGHAQFVRSPMCPIYLEGGQECPHLECPFAHTDRRAPVCLRVSRHIFSGDREALIRFGCGGEHDYESCPYLVCEKCLQMGHRAKFCSSRGMQERREFASRFLVNLEQHRSTAA
jgi:hypothetical protein